jgi:hypothetical protein
MHHHHSIAALAAFISISSFACSAADSDPDPSSGSQDVVATPSGGATGSPATPKILLSCSDKKTANPVLLTIDTDFRFTWRIGDVTASATLAGADRIEESPSFELLQTSGSLLILNPDDLIIGVNGMSVTCDPRVVKLDRAAIEALVAKTAASRAEQKTFAVCKFDGDTVNPSETFLVRPSLDGSGALIEGQTSIEQRVVLHAKEIVPAGDAVTYKGEGGITNFTEGGQLSAKFATLTSTPTAGGAITLSWDAKTAAGKPLPLAANRCTLSDATLSSFLQR